MNFKAEVFTGDRWWDDGLVFAMEHEAVGYGRDCMMKRYSSASYRVKETDSAVTHMWSNGKVKAPVIHAVDYYGQY